MQEWPDAAVPDGVGEDLRAPTERAPRKSFGK